MPFVAPTPARYLGTAHGTGHCAALVREATGAPHTSEWRQGPRVRDAQGLAPGTAIATFDPNGRYGNHTDGRSHAALLIAVEADGLRVVDQWQGQPAHERLIRFRAGQGDAVNDGDAYHVAEPA